MKKVYVCLLILLFADVLNAQKNDCSAYKSDDMYLRYTAVGCQEVVNGNHSKAINESRKIANIIATKIPIGSNKTARPSSVVKY